MAVNPSTRSAAAGARQMGTIIALALLSLGVHLAANALGGYGYFRDELYYIACSRHLAAGYVDQPPLSIFVLAAAIPVLGNSVFATAGSDEKARACEALGARRGINYRTEDFAAAVKSETGGRGVDVILDMVAGDYLPREIACLADDGRLAIIALLGGAQGQVDLSAGLSRAIVPSRHPATPYRFSG